MSVLGRVFKIVRAPVDLGAQLGDFVIDGITHLPEARDESGFVYAPIRSYFESFKDNIVGQASMTGEGDKSVLKSVFGPEGMLGATVGGLPEEGLIGMPRRKFGDLFWDPSLSFLQFAYKNGVDRPIGSIATLWSLADADAEFDDTEPFSFNPFEIGDTFTGIARRANRTIPGMSFSDLVTDPEKAIKNNQFFNLDTYSDVWEITNSRSAGQAIMLAQQRVNILDPRELQQAKGTLWYQMGSGLIDFSLNIVGDPAFLVVKGVRGARAMKRMGTQFDATGNVVFGPKDNLSPFVYPQRPPKKRNSILYNATDGRIGRGKGSVAEYDEVFSIDKDRNIHYQKDPSRYDPMYGKTPEFATIDDAIISPEMDVFKQRIQTLVVGEVGYRSKDAHLKRRTSSPHGAAADKKRPYKGYLIDEALEASDEVIEKAAYAEEVAVLVDDIDTELMKLAPDGNITKGRFDLAKAEQEAFQAMLEKPSARTREAWEKAEGLLDEWDDLISQKRMHQKDALANLGEVETYKSPKTEGLQATEQAARKIQRDMQAGRFGGEFKMMDPTDQWGLAKVLADLVPGNAPIGTSAWIPFDNFLKLRLNGKNAIEAFEAQAPILAKLLFGDNGLAINQITNIAEVQNALLEARDILSKVPEDSARRQPLRVIIDGLEQQEKMLYNAAQNRIATVLEDVKQVIDSADDQAQALWEIPARGTPEFTQVMNEVAAMDKIPWLEILNANDNFVKTLVEEASPVGFANRMPVDKLDASQAAVRGISELAVNEIARTSNLPILPNNQLPFLGPMNRAGFQARTFFEKTFDGVKYPKASRAYRAITEMTTQSIISFSQAGAAYRQFDRMLRDADRVVDENGVSMVTRAGLNREQLLIEFLNNTADQIFMKDHFEKTVGTLMDQLVDMVANTEFNPRGLTFDKQELVSILRGDLDHAKRQIDEAADAEEIRRSKAYGNVDYQYTSINFARDGESLRLHVPLSPSQLRESLIVPRFDMFQRVVKEIKGDFKEVYDAQGNIKEVHIGKSRAVARHTALVANTMWKRSVLLTPRWQMVVNIDSLLRSFAHVGATAVLGQIGPQMDTLKSRWLRGRGVDVTKVVEDELFGFLDSYYEGVIDNPWEFQDPKYRTVDPDARIFVTPMTEPQRTLAQAIRVYEQMYDNGAVSRSLNKVFEDAIDTAYASKSYKRRVSVMTAAGLYFAGPVGAAAAAALYTPYHRSSVAKLARHEIAQTYGNQLRFDAHHLLEDVAYQERNLLTIEDSFDVDGRPLTRDEQLDLLKESLGEDFFLEAQYWDALVKGDAVEYSDWRRAYDEGEISLEEAQMLDLAEQLVAKEDLSETFRVMRQNRREAAKLLEARAENLDTFQRQIVDDFIAEYPEIAGRFERAGDLLAESGYPHVQVGNVVFDPAYGDIPAVQAVWEKANSANATNRTLWATEVDNQRKSQLYQGAHQYDILTDAGSAPIGSQPRQSFVNAWDDYMDRHAGSLGPSGVAANRDFYRQYWLGKTDDEIVQWLQSGEGRKIDLPDEWRNPETIYEMVGRTRWEAGSLVPDLPIFKSVRERLAQGDTITWERDIQPLLDEAQREIVSAYETVVRTGIDVHGEGATNRQVYLESVFFRNNPHREAALTVFNDLVNKQPVSRSLVERNQQAARELSEMPTVLLYRKYGELVEPWANNEFYGLTDFGKTVNDSSFLDARQTMWLRKEAKGLVRDFFEKRFENLTMVEDVVSRGTLYKSVYERQVAMELQPYRIEGGKYRVDEKDVKNIQNRARRTALHETKVILYDLAEKSRFQELTTLLMPFLGAWQEVATRGVGIAAQNPVFVARTLRPWHVLTSKDENNQTRLVFQLPGVFATDTPGPLSRIPGFDKLFGDFSALAEQKVDLNLGSASMIGGLPGGGPIVCFGAAQLQIVAPELMQWIPNACLPYGPAEGDNVATQFIDAFTPSWTQAFFNAKGMDTDQRARTAATVLQSYLTELSEQGIVVGRGGQITEDEVADEVERRVQHIFGMFMARSLAFPVSFQQQSPYWATLSDFWKRQDEYGSQEAVDWLLENHPDMWAFTARRTNIKSVVAGTLEGRAAIKEHQEFADRNPELGRWVTGEIGPLDVQFAYNEAVARLEKIEGKREYLDSKGLLKEAQTSIGWREFRVFRNSRDSILRERAEAGGSVSLLARANYDLFTSTQDFVAQLAETNPLWFEEYNAGGDPERQRRILRGFRDAVADPAFEKRPDIVPISQYLELHDQIAQAMVERAEVNQNRNFLQLSYRGNADLQQQWEVGKLRLLRQSDFGSVYDYFFSNIATVSVGNLPRTRV